MAGVLRFVFVGEGSSDSSLVPLLELLCVRAGATRASGLVPDLARLRPPPGNTVAAKVAAALRV